MPFKKLSFVLLLTLSLNASSQEVIGEMTRDRLGGYIDELLKEIRGRKTCDSCKNVFDFTGITVIDDSFFQVYYTIKYPENGISPSTSYRFKTSQIDTATISPYSNELLELKVHFTTKSVYHFFQKNRSSNRTDYTYTDTMTLFFFKADKLSGERILYAFRRLKEVSVEKKI